MPYPHEDAADALTPYSVAYRYPDEQGLLEPPREELRFRAEPAPEGSAPVKKGMEEKSKEFAEKGNELYAKA